MFEVIFELTSPLIIGDKRLKDNFIKSIDYIPGNLIRAAYAKKILLECHLYDISSPDKNGKFNMVYIRDEKSCNECKNYNLCKNFSDIKFSFFYPYGVDVIPLTAEKCKYNEEHGFFDGIFKTKNNGCIKCGENGRLESVSGFRIENRKFELKKVSITKTSIDKYTKRAKEGSLYTIEAVKEKDKYYDRFYEIDKGYSKRRNITFIGYISGMSEDFLYTGDIIRVGKKSTSGFGKLKLETIKSIEEGIYKEFILNKINEFNKRIKNFGTDVKFKIRDYNSEKIYFPIMLKSNARFGIENEINKFNKSLENNEYKNIWNKLLFGDNKKYFEIEKVWAENDIYRGFDTSKEWDKWSNEPIIQTKLGSTFLVSTKNLELSINLIEKIVKEGVGNQTKDGFGEIEICNELHLKGNYNMKKSKIIDNVNKFTDNKNNKELLLRIEKTQYRDMVEVCKNAEFLKEIELYIKYKIAKSSRDWGYVIDFKTKKTLGDMFIDELNNLIEKKDNNLINEKETMENVSKYFGYLNWKMSYLHNENKLNRRNRGGR